MSATSATPLASEDLISTRLTPSKNNSGKQAEADKLKHYDQKLMDEINQPLQIHSETPTEKDNTPGPLSWNEARHRLKITLELWNKQEQMNTHSQSIKFKFITLENLDILLAILLSIAFVILSFTLPTQDLSEFVTSQRIASVLFLLSSVTSALISNRWATVREQDQSIERRRCVTAFLKEMELMSKNTESSKESKTVGSEEGLDKQTDVIPRKNVEDVYSTYRLNNHSQQGQWHRIPLLLLVKGDYIALKVGDTCPQCKSIKKERGETISIHAGQRLSIDLLGVNLSFPPGKSTVKTGEDLLMLANGVRVFELLETPLETFLNRDMIVSKKPPQILRQGQAVRLVLLCAAFTNFMFTTAILLIRPSVRPQNFFTTPTWTIPLLSALSFLPITTPMFLFFLECIGTARILTTVHPWASNQKQINGFEKVIVTTPPRWLFYRYLVATFQSRLKSSVDTVSKALLTIPPASVHVLEKLGLVTAIALIDDELACESHSTPQQLLIPSKDGRLKILDLCPTFNEDDEECSTDEDENEQLQLYSSRSSNHFHRNADLDSDDEDIEETRFAHSFSAPARSLKKKLRKRYSRKKSLTSRTLGSGANKINSHQAYFGEGNDDDVQFEDPLWWQYLPSLKCIGLSCLLMEIDKSSSRKEASTSDKVLTRDNPNQKVTFDFTRGHLNPEDLVKHLCIDRERKQLRVLARCIGFNSSPSVLAQNGDLSSFIVRRRLHIISSDLLCNRMNLKYHAMGLEESRNWSRLYTDADTVFVKDIRSGGDLILTVGDARVVTELCPDWWQGENSTISPLIASDRQFIIETQNNWMLSDLDVQAFSYAPLPYTADNKIGSHTELNHIYLLNNGTNEQSVGAGRFWSLVKNQIFLGLLGSSVRPRKEIEHIITASADAGVRFVYFSPRNMRRTKELASQMGIDVAWNCAISLRPLSEGEDDLYRMTSNYADWDVNARLPHGVDDVKRHLKEVDNVPLLVSLYTDVTKKTTCEMVNVFQDYNDTVLSVGLSHLPGNHDIFSRADIAIGVDVLTEDCFNHNGSSTINENALYPAEVSFIASISAHSCMLNLWGSKATCHLLEFIRIGRASLEAATSSAMFFVSALISFGVFLLLCPCTIATLVPIVPAIEVFLYIQIILHGICLSMASTNGTNEQMTRVPPKNDASLRYSFKQSTRWYTSLFLRSVPSSIISHVIYLVALGELMWGLDQKFVEEHCSFDNHTMGRPSLGSIIRCKDLKSYSGPPIIAAGILALSSLALCTTILSASFVFRTEPIFSEVPWRQNCQWAISVVISIILIFCYLMGTLERGTMLVLPGYFYVMFVIAPFVSIALSEMVKHADQKQEKRAVMMRRLQFETRLGMWSPKESTHIAINPENIS